MKKHFIITEEELKIIENTLEEYSFLENQSAALRYIIQQYCKQKVLCEEEKEVKKLLTIAKSIEKIVGRILDAINTILVVNEIENCYPVEYFESPVLTKSREYERKRLANLKQRKDYENRKKSSKKSAAKAVEG